MRLNYYFQIFITGTILLAFSCGSKPEKTSLIEEELHFADSSTNYFSLVIDERTSLFNFLSSQATISEKPKFLVFNEILNSIDQYSLLSGKIEKRIAYPKDGPNSIPIMQIPFGLHYVNPDTLILFSGLLETLYLANLKGEIYHELELTGESVGFGSAGPVSPIAYKEGEVYMQSLPRIPIEIPNDYIAPLPGIARINLTTGKYEELPLPYPGEYKNKQIAQQLKMIDLVYNANKERFIINFPLSDELLVTDFDGDDKWILAKSELINEPLETDRSNAIIEASKLNNMYYWMNSAYDKIIYEPNLDIYIRAARSGISDEAYVNRNLSSERELLILDSNFELMKKVKYSSAEMFYHFFLDDSFYWNKDIQTYNIQRGIEDTLYFHQTQLIRK